MTKYRAMVTETYIIELDSDKDIDSDALYEEFKVWAENKDDVVNDAFKMEAAEFTVTHRNWDDIEEVRD